MEGDAVWLSARDKPVDTSLDIYHTSDESGFSGLGARYNGVDGHMSLPVLSEIRGYFHSLWANRVCLHDLVLRWNMMARFWLRLVLDIHSSRSHLGPETLTMPLK